jgi:dolichyl-phosphate-mannose-protein mannosyltransferase
MAQSLAEHLDSGPAPAPAVGRRTGPRRLLLPLVVLALLAAMAFAMVSAALAQTPTTDEPVYVGTAVVYLQQHSLRYNPEHPPLGKLIMDTGLWFAHPRLDPAFSGDQWELGEQLLYRSGNDPWRLMFLARLPIIVLTLLFGLVVFLFARDLTGAAGGVAALALYAFDPDLITHGSLATLDVPAAGFLLTSAWLLWRARRRPAVYLPLAGLALGAALATRMSVLPAVPVLLALAVLSYWQARRSVWRGVSAAAGVAAIAVAVVWLCYLAVDPQLRFTPVDVPVIPGIRGLVTSWMPLPRPYRDGMRIQFGFEDSRFGGFLFGKQYDGSLWYYLPAALLVKTPLGAMVLWLGGAATMLSVRRLRPAAPYVLVPAAVLFAAALAGTRDFGTRYAIFLPMFLAVAAAALVTVRRRWVRLGTAALVLWVAVSSARTYPYYLPYSNEAFGGPSKTYLRLHDSNSDWGQDLGRVADRLRERYPGQHVWIVYKGGGDPQYYIPGSAYPLDLPSGQIHGLLVVSNDAIDKADPPLTALLSGSRPLEQVGHSITIFRR